MIHLVLSALVILILAANVLCALGRGVSKARIRGVLILLSAVGAVLATITLRATLVSDAFVKETLVPMLESLNNATLTEMVGLSETLNQVIIHTVASLINTIL